MSIANQKETYLYPPYDSSGQAGGVTMSIANRREKIKPIPVHLGQDRHLWTLVLN